MFFSEKNRCEVSIKEKYSTSFKSEYINDWQEAVDLGIQQIKSEDTKYVELKLKDFDAVFHND